jgi:glyoxylase-like metal-dependent hydrolase (beta-lactamase superfamily II)
MALTITPRPAPAEVLSFGPLRFIPGRKGGRYPYCHSLVLTGPETWVVDPAADQDYFRNLAGSRRVTRVFLSHFHEDHQKYNYLFPEAHFGWQRRGSLHLHGGIFRFMGLKTRFQEYWRETLVRDFQVRPLPNYPLYFPGDRFHLGDITLEIIPAPGHTPGHSCCYFPHQEILFLADVDLTPFGPWYGDATSSLEDYEATLKSLGQRRTRTYLTAHEQGVFSFEEFQAGLHYFRQVLADRERRLLSELKAPRTLAQLVARPHLPQIKEPTFVYEHMEGQMVQKHLDRLLKKGRSGIPSATK